MLAKRRFRKRSLSMTSLIDVIFLLLLFFMLSSTFARHGELPFSAGTSGSGSGEVPIFLRLSDGDLSINGTPVTLKELPQQLQQLAPEGGPVIVALAGAVNAQSLVDVLAVMRRVPDIDVTVID